MMTEHQYDRLEKILKAMIEDSRRRERKWREEQKWQLDELIRRNEEWKASKAADKKPPEL